MAEACGSQAGSKTGMYTVHNDRRLFTMFNMSGTKNRCNLILHGVLMTWWYGKQRWIMGWLEYCVGCNPGSSCDLGSKPWTYGQ